MFSTLRRLMFLLALGTLFSRDPRPKEWELGVPTTNDSPMAFRFSLAKNPRTQRDGAGSDWSSSAYTAHERGTIMGRDHFKRAALFDPHQGPAATVCLAESVLAQWP
jgi:hypothetical protein